MQITLDHEKSLKFDFVLIDIMKEFMTDWYFNTLTA